MTKVSKAVNWVGKEVKISPSHTHSKQGVIKEINNNGITFLITKSDAENTYPLGKLVYISHSIGVRFCEI